MIGDRHVHTRFSLDSSASVRDVLNQAVRLGMKEICITDHCDFDLGEEWIMPVKEYSETLLAYKKEYEDRIRIHIGIEMGLNPQWNDQIRTLLASFPFEYVIGSIHTMQGDDPYYRDRYDMDDREFFRIYLETLKERIKESDGIDVCGHFDYVVRYGMNGSRDYDPQDYAEIIDDILKEIIRRDIALELNTAGLRKNAGFIHPHRYVLNRYRELGGKWISVGSDAHFADHVGMGFAEAENLLKKFGFTEKNLKPVRTQH